MSARIAILGAGPAGTAFALRLLQLGVAPSDFILIDKAKFPRPKLCGGGVTYRGTELLTELVGKPPGGGVSVGLEFRSVVGDFDVREKGPQWVYDRSELDAFLLDACIARGVQLRDETTVSDIEMGHEQTKLTMKTASGTTTESFAWVIGADGANSIARRASGLRGGIVGRLVEAVFEKDGGTEREDTLYFDFDPICDRIPGYAWIFPYFVSGQVVGWKIGVMDGRGVVPGEKLRSWTLDYAKERGYRLADEKIAGWPERYWDWRTRGHKPGLLLIGEAFGIDPLLGEGIAPAMFNALYAADRLKQALDQGTRTIRHYERDFMLTEEGMNLWFQSGLADRIYGRHPERWLRVLFSMKHLRNLAGSGNDAYGRLVKHLPVLMAKYGVQVLRDGIPSAAPIVRKRPSNGNTPT